MMVNGTSPFQIPYHLSALPIWFKAHSGGEGRKWDKHLLIAYCAQDLMCMCMISFPSQMQTRRLSVALGAVDTALASNATDPPHQFPQTAV